MIATPVACAGELLWDVLPSGRTLGGAPVNVAYHLAQLGVPAAVVSRVGDDDYGREAAALLAARKIDVSRLQRDPDLPTGAAIATLDAEGRASYRFVTPAAWDALEDPGLEFGTVVFGTLGQRAERSRLTLRALAGRATTRVLDVNLRAPHFDRELVERSLELATWLKLSEDELPQLAEWLDLPPTAESFAAGVAERSGLEACCVTLGARGAVLAAGGAVHSVPGETVDLVDTVGAGDAFLAGLLASRATGRSWRAALQRANRIAAFVASRAGAMPSHEGFDGARGAT